MSTQLASTHLPADWSDDLNRTTEVLVARIRAMPDEDLIGFNDDLGLLHDTSDQVRNELEEGLRSMMKIPSFMIGDLLVAEGAYEGSSSHHAIVVLNEAGLCKEPIGPPEN